MTSSLLAANIFLSSYSQSDFFGKLIFLGLFALSIACWIVLIQKTWMTRNVQRVSLSFQKAIAQNKRPLFSLDVADLPKQLNRALPNPFAEIFDTLKQKSVELLNKNHFFSAKDSPEPAPVYLSPKDLELIESHVLTTISSQTKLLEKNLFVLSTIATLAPFLGLLGTVWGILITFSELHSGASAGSNAAMLGGLSTALATTVLGLVIAIPALVAYNYLKNSVRTFSSDMEDFLYLLLSTVELQYRKVN
ncbi:MAG: MotA/TolQ/ExbB proton channel family protein [Chlamydiales bacterium]|nr:MotA/TolQ/ExbB proton channel family protein [Chlamydiales bacterium]